MVTRRPHGFVDSVFLFNVKDEDGAWIPQKVSKGMWVLLQCPRNKKRRGNSGEFINSWKARVLDFKLSPSGKVVSEILIEHVYMHREIKVHPTENLPRFRPNYVYPSSYKQWEPAQSITGTFDCIHGSIGELQYKGRKHNQLAEQGIFFYDSMYHPPKHDETYGTVDLLPVPNFSDPCWPLPDTTISESFRCRMFNDVQSTLKPRTSGKKIRLVWLMPLSVFVDFFARTNIRRTNTMFICNSLEKESISEMLDDGWETKISKDIHCKIEQKSISFRYVIGKQNLCMSFWYIRYHIVNGKLIPMDQDLSADAGNNFISFDVILEGNVLTNITLKENCTIAQLRHDLENDEADVPEMFDFFINNSKVFTHS